MGLHSQGKTPIIQALTDQHRSMVRVQLAGNLSPMQLARYFGFTPGHVTRIINSPAYIAEKNRLEQEIEARVIDKATRISELTEIALADLSDDLTIEVTDSPELRRIRQKAYEVTLEIAKMKGKDAITIIKNTTNNVIQQNIGKMSVEELQKEIFDITDMK